MIISRGGRHRMPIGRLPVKPLIGASSGTLKTDLRTLINLKYYRADTKQKDGWDRSRGFSLAGDAEVDLSVIWWPPANGAVHISWPRWRGFGAPDTLIRRRRRRQESSDSERAFEARALYVCVFPSALFETGGKVLWYSFLRFFV